MDGNEYTTSEWVGGWVGGCIMLLDVSQNELKLWDELQLQLILRGIKVVSAYWELWWAYGEDIIIVV